MDDLSRLESWHRIYLRTLLVCAHDLSRDNLQLDGTVLPESQWQLTPTQHELLGWGLIRKTGHLIRLTESGERLARKLTEKPHAR